MSCRWVHFVTYIDNSSTYQQSSNNNTLLPLLTRASVHRNSYSSMPVIYTLLFSLCCKKLFLFLRCQKRQSVDTKFHSLLSKASSEGCAMCGVSAWKGSSSCLLSGHATTYMPACIIISAIGCVLDTGDSRDWSEVISSSRDIPAALAAHTPVIASSNARQWRGSTPSRRAAVR